MLVKQAKDIAQQWVLEESARSRAIQGAYLAGSVALLDDENPLPKTSDLDINVLYESGNKPADRTKFIHRDVLIEITPLSMAKLQPPSRVLSHTHLAGGFVRPNILFDPSGRLTALQSVVSREFARRTWVRQRCEHARRRVVEGIEYVDTADVFDDQVMSWLFATGVTTHILLVAGLRNPTVRDRYTAARKLLEDFGRLDFYESLLGLLDLRRLSRERVDYHVRSLERMFDAAAGVIETPCSFVSDISEIARPVAVDGSRELIERGLHREAIFWIAVTFVRCRKVLTRDANPAMQKKFDGCYAEILEDLGVASSTTLRQRCDQVMAFLPSVWDVTETVMAENRAIQD
jgi:hypothetical protein